MIKDCYKFSETTIEVKSYVKGLVFITINEHGCNNYPCQIVLDAVGVNQLVRQLLEALPK